MRLNLPVLDEEYPFPEGESLVSTTDLKGKILYCNPAFIRVSGYAREQLLAEKQPSGEFVTPEQLGELALFLCSENAIHVRGAAWNMDGGWVAQ